MEELEKEKEKEREVEGSDKEDSVFEIEEAELEEVYRQMRDSETGIKPRTIGPFYWKTDKCFKGYEVIMWLMKNYTHSEAVALAIAHKMLESGFFYQTKDPALPFENSATLFRFHADTDDKVLNMKRLCTEGGDNSPDVVQTSPTEEVNATILQPLYACMEKVARICEKAKCIPYTIFPKSDDFQEFADCSFRLQQLKLEQMEEAEKKAFFINMYNFLMIHAKVSAITEPTIQRSEQEYVYMIGKHKFCLADIYHGVLRCNRRPAGLSWKRFGAEDLRAEFTLSAWDPRIHFALLGTASNTEFHVYKSVGLDSDLTKAAESFCRNNISIVPDKKHIECPKLFYWYRSDFGETEKDTLQAVAEYLTEEKKKELLTILDTAGLFFPFTVAYLDIAPEDTQSDYSHALFSPRGDKTKKEVPIYTKENSANVLNLPTIAIVGTEENGVEENQQENPFIVIEGGEFIKVRETHMVEEVIGNIHKTKGSGELELKGWMKKRHITPNSPSLNRTRRRGTGPPTFFEGQQTKSLYKTQFQGKPHSNYMGTAPSGNAVCVSIRTTETGKQQLIVRTSKGDDQIMAHAPNQNDLWESLRQMYPDCDKQHLQLVINTPKLEKDLVRLEKRKKLGQLKVGVLYYTEGQTQEDEIFSNVDVSEGFKQFLAILGTEIQLKGWNKYAGGLDVTNDQMGTHSVFSDWTTKGGQCVEIMFHVMPYLPLCKYDTQQIERKRHLGNDVVVVAFHECKSFTEFTPWNAAAITTKYIHVYVVVHAIPLTEEEKQQLQGQEDKGDVGDVKYKVAILKRNSVPEFGPPLPLPPIFYDRNLLRVYLLNLIVSATMSSLRAPKFKEQMLRTQKLGLQNIIDSYCPPQEN